MHRIILIQKSIEAKSIQFIHDIKLGLMTNYFCNILKTFNETWDQTLN